VYVEQTGHTTEAMYKEMECHISPNQMDKSVIAINEFTTANVNDMTVLATSRVYMGHLVKKAIWIQQHTSNFSIDNGFTF
jgi:hypothetical protein